MTKPQVVFGNMNELLAKAIIDTTPTGAVGEEPTGFFRVFTSYGICATSYTTQGNGGVFYYDNINRGFDSCKIR